MHQLHPWKSFALDPATPKRNQSLEPISQDLACTQLPGELQWKEGDIKAACQFKAFYGLFESPPLPVKVSRQPQYLNSCFEQRWAGRRPRPELNGKERKAGRKKPTALSAEATVSPSASFLCG